MAWYVKRVSLPGSLSEPFEERLLAQGITNFSVERQPGEPRAKLSIFAKSPDSLPDSDSLFRWLAAVDPDNRVDIESIGPAALLADQEWDAGFRAHFARCRLTPLLEVVPSWERQALPSPHGRPVPGPGSEIQMVIEPGQAFGTGDHPTTAGCLRRLEKRMTDPGSGHWSVLDIGSGTGILSLAARLWGADRVVGYDNDPTSIVNSWLNSDLNGLSGKVSFLWGEAENPGEEEWDLILCNLFLGPILRLIPRMDRALKPGGKIILSGFLADQAGEVGKGGRARNLNLDFEEVFDGWAVQEWSKP
jgi:ribosomal protein L11 methyltransferase